MTKLIKTINHIYIIQHGYDKIGRVLSIIFTIFKKFLKIILKTLTGLLRRHSTCYDD